MIDTRGFFAGIFKNATENSIILLDVNGKILDVNKGFLSAFGYSKKELVGKNFKMLFTEIDRQEGKPELEIKATLAQGSKSDNNYLVSKEGLPIWVLGESISTTNTDGEKFIVKIIQNINTQKKLEGFLMESNEFINTVFDSVKDAAFVILNSELRIIKTNKIFLRVFGVKKLDIIDVKLSRVGTGFWNNAEVKKQITNVLVNRKAMKDLPFTYVNEAGKSRELLISSKLMENEGIGRTILLVIKLA